jgi:hypothetical protein
MLMLLLQGSLDCFAMCLSPLWRHPLGTRPGMYCTRHPRQHVGTPLVLYNKYEMTFQLYAGSQQQGKILANGCSRWPNIAATPGIESIPTALTVCLVECQ